MRDRATAATIVRAVWEALDPIFGTTMVDRYEFEDALDDAVDSVADLLDPEEVFDVEIAEDDPAEVRHCPDCGALCDFRVMVCECIPEVCPRAPVAR